MATRTSYLNLIKPDYTDAADIADINANMDTLDDKIKKIDSAAIDDTLVPTSDSGTIRNQLSQLANRIKAATGTVGWKDDPSTTLASLATLVSNLASGSDVTWDGKKFTNTKLGISGLMDTNGYVSFGKNFGGLIIQWGTATGSKAEAHVTSTFNVTLPINYQEQIAQVFVNTATGGTNDTWDSTTVWAQVETVKSFVGSMVAGHPFTIPPKIRWVTLGK